MKTITISLYNREQYTARLFDNLNKCYGIEEYAIAIFCEPDQPQIHNLANQFRPDQTTVTINPSRFGCNTNIFQCLAHGFNLSDYHIHFEDDTIPGKDCLKYFEWAKDLRDDNTIFTVSGYVNSDNNTEHHIPKNSNINGVSKRQWFTPWGWATWKDRWNEIKSVWDFSGRNGSWDTTVNHVCRKDRFELFPLISRIQNIGAEKGTHVPNAEWHSKNHFNEYWIETLNQYPENYGVV